MSLECIISESRKRNQWIMSKDMRAYMKGSHWPKITHSPLQRQHNPPPAAGTIRCWWLKAASLISKCSQKIPHGKVIPTPRAGLQTLTGWCGAKKKNLPPPQLATTLKDHPISRAPYKIGGGLNCNQITGPLLPLPKAIFLTPLWVYCSKKLPSKSSASIAHFRVCF